MAEFLVRRLVHMASVGRRPVVPQPFGSANCRAGPTDLAPNTVDSMANRRLPGPYPIPIMPRPGQPGLSGSHDSRPQLRFERHDAMLIAMKSKLAKWVLGAIFGLVGGAMIVSLGFGDLFRGTTRPIAAIRVGDTEIYRDEVNQEFNKVLDQISRAFGTQLDTEQGRAMGLMDSAVRNLVTRTLFEKYAADLGLDASQDHAMVRLASEPGMLDATGHIDRVQLLEFMRSGGYTEESLMIALRKDIVRDQLYTPVAVGAEVPDALVDLIFSYRNERRVAQTLLIDTAALPEPAEPDDATLRAYYEENGAMFMAPEYRSIDYVWVTAATFEDQVLIDDARLRQEFAARRSEFDQPELRHVEQILFQDQESANTAMERIAAGEDFAAVAEDVTGAAPIDMGQMESTGVVSDLSILVETAFAVPVGEATGPIETLLGWHVIRVIDVTPAHSPGFEEVRDLLADEMKQEIAVDRMIETANLIDDELAAGAALADAAATAGIVDVPVDAVDAQGLGVDGTPALDQTASAFLADLAFRTEPGDTSLLTEDPSGSGYAVVQVIGSTPPSARPFDQVRDDVLAAWRREAHEAKAREKAEEIESKIAAGRPLSDIAAAEGFTVSTSKPVTRSEGDSVANLPSSVTGALFGLEPGASASGPIGNGYVVAVLKEIQPVDPAVNPDRTDALRTRMETELATDLLNAFAMALRQRYPVEIDPTALQQDF
jgi:peptidyl-prolyl cis-trans isomerase D